MEASSCPSSPVTPSPLLGGSFPIVLRKLLENPPKDFLETRDEKDKSKLDKDDDHDCNSLVASASLMPPIWDKTIPYDGESFHLEYMDLDEFLLENGIPSSPTQLAQALQNPLVPVSELESDSEPASTSAASPLSPSVLLQKSEVKDSDSKAEEDPPSPIDPEKVEIQVNFNPDPSDLLLSTVPGEELFDPRKHRFAEEELKPQPMIKKAKKIYVPEDLKDEKYWTRRNKNNVAAKRSRDARRLKENQITVRAAFLEKENSALRSEVADLRKELSKCRNIISKYEKQFGLFDFSDSE
ncbi:thyrotroph embryonic factor [Xenopus tropicalis]|uniref:Thyrotroph embryonic factor n=1 Tax=Xenopus tropicalis TaxID=8364 RepID=Q28DN7_XENTR|nr:thyrotroph embryonic factor [Xenopus tropicalis]CAJ83354.1 thyrotrophic embryonic factor [Xenopus tropicalis]|eukprot:NP_001017319.1 thyrotroph embryonic factor [Xenopus tropicalis]